LSSSPGDSIPLVCQDWANTKAAYRFLDNDRVSEAEILAGHFQATHERFAASAAASTEPILVLHDTTEFSFKRDDVAPVGITRKVVSGVYPDRRIRHYTACSILMHSSLAVTTEGLPLGLAAVKFWSRDKFKGTNALKKKINPTRVPIEEKESTRPGRCVHIGDRESDIYELFCTAKDVGTHFLLRTCVDRLAGDGSHTIAAEMAEVNCKGLHRVEGRDHRGELSEAILELKFRRIRVLPRSASKAAIRDLSLPYCMRPNAISHVVATGSTGSSSPIFRSDRALRRSKSFAGTRNAGRLRRPTRSSSPDVGLSSRSSELLSGSSISSPRSASWAGESSG